MPTREPPPLSDFHRQLLMILVTGATDAMIASRLYVSESTVRRRLGEISDMLGQRKRCAIVAEAYRRGYIPAERQ